MRDLLGRAAELEQAQHLGLPRRQVRMGRPGRVVVVNVLGLAEDTDYMATLAERNRAELDGEPLAVRVHDYDLVIRAGRWPEEGARKDLPCSPRFLGCDDRGELASANVPNEPARCWVQPADDPVAVDHVGGHTDPGDRICHLAAKRLELGHSPRVWWSRSSGASSANRGHSYEVGAESIAAPAALLGSLGYP